MNWYKTGQINITNGSRTVVGVGTNFTRFVEVGEALLGPDGQHYEITSVPSATELRIGKNYAGPTAANQSYTIVPVQGYVRDLAHKAADLIDAHKGVPAEALSHAEAAAQSVAEAQAANIGAKEARDAAAESAASAAASATAAAGTVSQVADLASQAQTSATAASDSATSASSSKTAAEAAATSATASTTQANASKVSAEASATSASTSATAAANSSSQALAHSESAAVSATTARTAANEAVTSNQSAGASATAAGNSATQSQTSATAAAASAAEALSSAQSAASSRADAEAAAASAQNRAALAAGYASSSTSSATEAASSAAKSTASATEAASSATAAANSSAKALTRANAAGASAALAEQSSQTAQAFKAAAEASAGAAADSAVESAASAAAALASKEGAEAVVNTVNEARDAALAHTATAKAWADKVDGEVEPGKYSARYWAEITAGAATGGVVYMGTWSAAGGVFPINPDRGHLYKVSVAGEIAGESYSVKDMIIYNGESWDKIDTTDEVTSVSGRVGAVILAKTDVGLGNVDNTSDASKPISTATQTALNAKEGTIASGTTSQFWRGDKIWSDFPSTVRASVLTGLSTATNAAVSAADTVLAAIGKLQAQITAHFGAGGAAHSTATSSVNGFMSGEDKAKLDAIAAGATANSTDVQLRNRATHTGTQEISTVSGLQVALDGKVDKVAGKGLSTEDYTTAEKTKLAGVVAGGGMPSYTYDQRGSLRASGAQFAVVDGLGLFQHIAGSTEPDDDESCFATATGRWLLQAAHWDLVDAWQLPEVEERDAYDEDEPLRFASSFASSFASKVLAGSATCAITSVASVSFTSFTGSVTGAAPGDRVIATPPAALGATAAETGRLSYHAWVSAADTVTVMLTNASAAAATTNAAVQTAWPVTVIKS